MAASSLCTASTIRTLPPATILLNLASTCTSSTPLQTSSAIAYTSIYTTTFAQLCPTGIQPATYTITESCSGIPTPFPPNHLPPNFTTTVVECHVCASTPITTTLTVPCSSQNSAPGVSATPPTGSSQVGSGQPGTPGLGGSTQGSGGGVITGGSTGGSAPPAVTCVNGKCTVIPLPPQATGTGGPLHQTTSQATTVSESSLWLVSFAVLASTLVFIIGMV